MLIVDGNSRSLSWCPNINVARNHLDDYKNGDTMIASRGIAEGMFNPRLAGVSAAGKTKRPGRPLLRRKIKRSKRIVTVKLSGKVICD